MIKSLDHVNNFLDLIDQLNDSVFGSSDLNCNPVDSFQAAFRSCECIDINTSPGKNNSDAI
jgi:hypothetical protein